MEFLSYTITIIALLITGFLAWQVQHLSKKRNQIDLKLKWIEDLRDLFSQWQVQLILALEKTQESQTLALAAKERIEAKGSDDLGVNTEFEKQIKELFGYTSIEQLKHAQFETSKLTSIVRKISMYFSSKDKRFIKLIEGHNYTLCCLKLLNNSKESERKRGREGFQTWQLFLSGDMQDIIHTEWNEIIEKDEKPVDYKIAIILGILFLLGIIALFNKTYIVNLLTMQINADWLTSAFF